MGWFSRKERGPDETCPQCGGAKSATMQTCTSCMMRRSADETGRGMPGERTWREEPRAGAPSTPPLMTEAETPFLARDTASPASRSTPSHAPSGANAPAAAAVTGNEYALNERNYPYRSKQGVYVRTPQELDCADYLFDNGVLFAYEPTIGSVRPSFLLPEKRVVVDGATGWRAQEREAAVKAAGYNYVPLPERNVKGGLRSALGPYFPGRLK